MSREARIELADLGAWGSALLLAEYDPEDDTIRIHAPAVTYVGEAFGAAEARRFVACAVAHERFHRSNPRAGETAARAHADAVCGVDSRRYEAALAAALQRRRG